MTQSQQTQHYASLPLPLTITQTLTLIPVVTSADTSSLKLSTSKRMYEAFNVTYKHTVDGLECGARLSD